MRDSEPGKIFIGGLSYHTTDGTSPCTDILWLSVPFRLVLGTLTDYFIRYGTIKDSVVMKEKDGKPRGFGFVTYNDPSAAEQVLGSPPGAHVIDGKAVRYMRTNLFRLWNP